MERKNGKYGQFFFIKIKIKEFFLLFKEYCLCLANLYDVPFLSFIFLAHRWNVITTLIWSTKTRMLFLFTKFITWITSHKSLRNITHITCHWCGVNCMIYHLKIHHINDMSWIFTKLVWHVGYIFST